MMQVKHLTITHKKDLTVLVDDLIFLLGPGDRAAITREEETGKAPVPTLPDDPPPVADTPHWHGQVTPPASHKRSLAQGPTTTPLEQRSRH